MTLCPRRLALPVALALAVLVGSWTAPARPPDPAGAETDVLPTAPAEEDLDPAPPEEDIDPTLPDEHLEQAPSDEHLDSAPPDPPTGEPEELPPPAAPEDPASIEDPPPVEEPPPADTPTPTESPASDAAGDAAIEPIQADAPVVALDGLDAAARPKPTPTPHEHPGAWATSIGPDNAGIADPGTSIAYAHVVTNEGRHAEVKNLAADSSSGWATALYEADGTTPLIDHDGDGLLDVGRLEPGAGYPILVVVDVPPGTPADTVDATTVFATSAKHPRWGGSAENITTVGRITRLTAEPSALSFGVVAADGSVDPAVSGVVSAVDESGAWYVIDGAIQVTVESNGPWSGSCWAEENGGTASTVTIAGGRLAWRPAGTEVWTPFPASDGPPPTASTCFPVPAAGSGTFVFDVRLRVEHTDPAGTFSTRLTFAATP